MTSKKVFIGMIAGIAIAGLALVGTLVLGDQLLQKQSAKLADLKVQNAVIDQQQTALLKAKKDLQAYAELNNIAKQIVPQDKDQARAVREIITIATQTGVHITSVSFPVSNLGQSSTTSTSSESSSSSTSAKAPPLSQVKPVDGIKGVYQLDITVGTDTTQPIRYAQLIDFLGRLEQNRRTAQITSLTIQPSKDNRDFLTFNLQLTIYIKP